MTASTLDWIQDKGVVPYYFRIDPYSEDFENPEFRILTVNETLEVKQYLQLPREIVERLEMCHSIWQFQFINNLESTHLISDHQGKTVLRGFNGPLKVYLQYPFSRVVELTINPICRRWNNGKTESFITVGYIFWQIAKTYAKIYKDQWREVGIQDFGLSDLYFEDCFIDDQGKASLFIGS